MDVARKAAVETVLTSISIGTFLYITFFEVGNRGICLAISRGLSSL